MGKNYTYSPQASIFRKSYGDINVTIILETPAGRKRTKDIKHKALLLYDELYNLLNDAELEEILTSKDLNLGE